MYAQNTSILVRGGGCPNILIEGSDRNESAWCVLTFCLFRKATQTESPLPRLGQTFSSVLKYTCAVLWLMAVTAGVERKRRELSPARLFWFLWVSWTTSWLQLGEKLSHDANQSWIVQQHCILLSDCHCKAAKIGETLEITRQQQHPSSTQIRRLSHLIWGGTFFTN